MTLPVWAACYYLTEIAGTTWRPRDYDTRNIVKLLKREPFKGYLAVRSNDTETIYDKTKSVEFIKRFGAVLGSKLAQEISGPISIVPIPASGMVRGGDMKFPIMELAARTAARYGRDAEVCPALVWNKARPKSHTTPGARHYEQFQPLLRLQKRPSHTVVVLDDVITSGSQMTAAARYLAERGYPPRLGIVGARVTRTQHERMIDWTKLELELEPGAIDWDDFAF